MYGITYNSAFDSLRSTGIPQYTTNNGINLYGTYGSDVYYCTGSDARSLKQMCDGYIALKEENAKLKEQIKDFEAKQQGVANEVEQVDTGPPVEAEEASACTGQVLPPVEAEFSLETLLNKWFYDEVDLCIQNKMDEHQRKHLHVLDLPKAFVDVPWESITEAIEKAIGDKKYIVALPHRVSKTCAIYEFNW